MSRDTAPTHGPLSDRHHPPKHTRARAARTARTRMLALMHTHASTRAIHTKINHTERAHAYNRTHVRVDATGSFAVCVP